MTATRTLITIGALLSAFASASPSSSAQTQKPATLASIKPTAASSWACPFAMVELAPVSNDTSGREATWVLVHRVNGEIIASERVAARDVAQIRAVPCGSNRQGAQRPLVG